MMTRLARPLLSLLLLWTAPAFGELKSVSVSPSAPQGCDPVFITVSGILPDACHHIVRAVIQGPVVVCVREPCPPLFYINITVQQPNPAETCLAANVPYSRDFRVGKLAPGDYQVAARERVIPFGADSTDSTVSETTATLAFTVGPDSTCLPESPGCYIVSFHDPLLDRPAGNFCDATTTPGGRACVPLSLTNSGNVAGLQTTVETFTFNGSPTVPFLHVVAVEPVRRASGFQVGWTEDGARTKILLYSNSGAVIPPGDGPVLRICYGVAPETIPDRYFVTNLETIVADPSGASIPPCPTPAVFAPGVLCVVAPGCDLNGDGVSDVLDIIRLVRCALASPGDACPDTIAARADCNGDGSVDIRDVVCCVRKIVGAEIGGTRAPSTGAVATSGAGAANQIRFDGPIRWIDAGTGVVSLHIEAADDWGGTQFAIDPGGAPVRMRRLALVQGGPGVQLEWAVGPDGVARGILYAATVGPRAAWSGRVDVTFDRTTGPNEGAILLRDAQAGNAVGEHSSIDLPNSILPVDLAPAVPVLLKARPNPFRASTEIAFVLPADARAELKVFDVHGRLVRSLVQGPVQAGGHRVAWDGVDGRGKAARSGVYFAKLTVGTVTLTERILLLR